MRRIALPFLRVLTVLCQIKNTKTKKVRTPRMSAANSGASCIARGRCRQSPLRNKCGKTPVFFYCLNELFKDEKVQLSANKLILSGRSTDFLICVHYPTKLFICLHLAFLFSCSQKMDTDTKKEMPVLLEKVANEKFFIPENMYASSVRIHYFDSLLQASPAHLKNKYLYHKAEALLYGGRTEEAIQILEDLLHQRNTSIVLTGMDDYEEDRIDDLLALAYLRLGEQQNCILNHTSASCIIPISPAGFHTLPEGSENAIRLYQQILEDNPRDLSSRWMLNVAYMTLGKYPQEVPKQWLIPEAAFASEYPLKKFTDVAPQTGLDVNALSGGGITEDFNNDGYLDVMVSSWFPNHQLQYFVNNQDGSFTDVTEEAGLTGTTGGLNMVQGDYNNDGFVDVFVLRGAWLEELGGHPNSLLRNNGDGSFSDVTREAGILSFHPTQTAVWRDFNNDGWLDLFIGNESFGPEHIHPCELYLNNQDGTFRDVAREAGVLVSSANVQGGDYYIKGVVAGDYNNDGWQDIFVSALDSRKSNILFKNEGVGEQGVPQFINVTAQAALDENISSFPTWFWDYNNDGWQDIFIAGYSRQQNVLSSITYDVAAEYLGMPFTAETARLYQNNGDGTFRNVSEEAGLKTITFAMAANFGDLDNDGFQDMYMSTGEVNFASIIPNRMFRNDEGKQFQDVTTAGGFGHLQKGHAVSFADLDNDGDQDVHVVLGGAYEGDVFQNALFENPYQDDNNWMTIKLTGTQANRSAIGSRVQLVITENGVEREIHRTVSPGGSFGCNPLRLQIGVGKAEMIDTINIDWAGSGTKQSFKQIATNRFLEIQEGSDSLKVLSLPSFKLSASHAMHQH